MAHWLHSTLGPAQLYADEEQARAALNRLVARLKREGYASEEVEPGRFRLTHATKGFVEAYIDMDGPEVGGDDET